MQGREAQDRRLVRHEERRAHQHETARAVARHSGEGHLQIGGLLHVEDLERHAELLGRLAEYVQRGARQLLRGGVLVP